MATYTGIKKIKIGDNVFTFAIPTKTSELTNDSGFITSAGVTSITTSAGTHSTKSSATGAVSFNVPTKTSHLTNDSGFITNAGVTSITTSAGTHTTKSSATGAVSFNVPTKTSHLTNDSGFITSYTDNKVSQTEDTTDNAYEVLLAGSTGTSTKTEGALKSANLTFMPNSAILVVDGTIGANLISAYETLAINGVSVMTPDASDGTKARLDTSNVLFNSGYRIAGHGTAVGYRMSNNGTKSLSSSNTPAAISAEVQLTAGTWLLIAAVDFPYTTSAASVKGVRHIAWYQGSSALNDTRITIPAYSNVQGFNTRLQSTTTVAISSTTNFYIYGFQNSDATMSVGYYWQALRIL